MLQNWSPPRKTTIPFFGHFEYKYGLINNFQKVFAFVTNSNLFHVFATLYSLPVAFGQGTKTNLKEKFNLSLVKELLILSRLSTTGLTQVDNSPGPLVIITTATFFLVIAANTK